MKQSLFLFFFITTVSIFTNKIYCQNLILDVKSSKKIDKDIFNKIRFKKKHKDTISINKELDRIGNYLKKNGFFLNTLDSLKKNNKKHTAYYNLGKKISFTKLDFTNYKNQTTTLHKEKANKKLLKIEDLEFYLDKITTDLDNEGKSFSKVYLKDLSIIQDTLFAKLNIEASSKRKVSRTIIKGYEKFPKSFIKNYFKINDQTTFSNKKLQDISSLTKITPFIEEVKNPEVLFTKDSTTLYIYLKKKKNNSFDGIVNFASKEDGGLLFNGNIDLQLNNILNTGENFTLFWNSVAEERQEFKLSTKIPYIFNFKFSPEIAFNIYKQDSTFYNTIFTSSFNYNINARLKLGLRYRNEISENLEASSNDISSFKSNLFGLILNYSILQKDLFNNKKFSFTIKPSFGSRITESLKSNQIRIESNISYVWKLNQRNSIYIENETGFLNSEKYFTNELFRIGGINSLRGFNEQSIFSRSYTFFNLEYRFLVSNTSYIYSITDFGVINNSNTDNLLGLGFGYQFIKNNSKINLGLIVGKTNKLPLNFNMTKLAVGWVNYF